MKGALVTFRKELLSYFVSPVSWVILVVFYLWRGYELTSLSYSFALTNGDPDVFVSATYGVPSTFWMVILVPGILTMRCFAEERRTGSMEMLMTAPVTDGGVVVGKWLAAAVFYALLWLPTAGLLHLVEYEPFLGTDLSFGPVFAAYLGMFLLSALLLAFGCFASSLTDNVLLAALLAILFDFGLLTLPRRLGAELGELGQNFYVRELLDKLDVNRNFSEWFARGLIDTSQVAFYVGGIVFFLFLTTLGVATRRVA
ncbi:MAG: ABC transporter permease subunit [Planctomycetes bacterium]|nr:ABC transporter permease subunit [Planctomycetota bacterium]